MAQAGFKLMTSGLRSKRKLAWYIDGYACVFYIIWNDFFYEANSKMADIKSDSFLKIISSSQKGDILF